MTILNLIRPDLAALSPYQMQENAFSLKLHANELPWSPVEFADLALNRYPNSELKKAVLQRLSTYYRMPAATMLLTRGSDEGIDLLMRLFLRAGQDSILQCPPTFSMYGFFARLQEAEVINCPLQENAQGFYLDEDALKRQWQPNCKLIMLCRPNNPTGEICSLDTIASLCQHFQNQSLIVVDEAYIEFANAPSAATLLAKFDNLIVLRTLSKAFGLAGLRIGVVMANPLLIQALQAIMAPFGFSDAILSLCLQALDNAGWFEAAGQKIIAARDLLTAALQKSAWIDKVYPSAANFLLIRSLQATALQTWLYEQHIAVRAFIDSPQLGNHLRVSIGDESQNTALLSALSRFRG